MISNSLIVLNPGQNTYIEYNKSTNSLISLVHSFEEKAANCIIYNVGNTIKPLFRFSVDQGG